MSWRTFAPSRRMVPWTSSISICLFAHVLEHAWTRCWSDRREEQEQARTITTWQLSRCEWKDISGPLSVLLFLRVFGGHVHAAPGWFMCGSFKVFAKNLRRLKGCPGNSCTDVELSKLLSRALAETLLREQTCPKKRFPGMTMTHAGLAMNGGADAEQSMDNFPLAFSTIACQSLVSLARSIAMSMGVIHFAFSEYCGTIRKKDQRSRVANVTVVRCGLQSPSILSSPTVAKAHARPSAAQASTVQHSSSSAVCVAKHM